MTGDQVGCCYDGILSIYIPQFNLADSSIYIFGLTDNTSRSSELPFTKLLFNTYLVDLEKMYLLKIS